MTSIIPVASPRGLFGRLLTPSLLDVFFGALLLGAFAHPQGVRSLLADGDTGWHIRTGELIVATGRAPVADPFSFTRPGQPWFAWEWLADVVFAQTWRWRGLAGVAALAGAVLALAATALLARMLRRGCGLWIGLAAAMAAVSASSIHYLARPHIFSILFYTLALWILAEDRLRHGRLVWVLIPLTALWVNLHAGFVAWLATLGLLLLLCAAQRDWPGAHRYGALLALCSMASLFNPYGWQLHLHIAGYLNSSWIMDHVQEFQSPHIRSEGMIVFALMLLTAVAMSPEADRFEGLLVVVWGFLALRSARHVPFFAIAAAPVLASGCAAYWQRLASRATGRAPLRIFWELAQEFGRRPRASLWLPITAAVVMAMAPAAGFPNSIFPVLAVERTLQQLTPAAAMPHSLQQSPPAASMPRVPQPLTPAASMPRVPQTLTPAAAMPRVPQPLTPGTMPRIPQPLTPAAMPRVLQPLTPAAMPRVLQQPPPALAMPRVLTSDQWADYLIFRLYPQQRVFFDGRSDFFGPAIGADYRTLLAGESPWRELLDRYQFDLALLPHDWPLSTALEREPGWRLVYRDSVAVLYARQPRGQAGVLP